MTFKENVDCQISHAPTCVTCCLDLSDSEPRSSVLDFREGRLFVMIRNLLFSQHGLFTSKNVTFHRFRGLATQASDRHKVLVVGGGLILSSLNINKLIYYRNGWIIGCSTNI